MPERVFPVIPEEITVHLGTPDATAENVTVPFVDYIKNVASSEIYPTWPEASLRSNIYAIISFALHRIYTEWYPSPGYVVRQGDIQPLFTQFCNGTTSRCEGLSQWGTVTLAESGLTPFEILQNYYGNDINLVENAPIEDIDESYPNIPIRLGSASNGVKIIQTQLNRISRNYPAIPKIAIENGIFGVDTENAVKKFQEIFNLPITGVVDKATWYRIKRYYNGVKRLAELSAEGVTEEEASLPYAFVLSAGMQGLYVRALQYYLDTVAYANPQLDMVPVTGIFDEPTVMAVEQFQQYYGLPVTGVADNALWNILNREYRLAVESFPAGYEGERAKIYPGYVLSEGMRGDSVSDLQTYLSYIGSVYPEIPEIPVTGYFGTQTRDAVYTFQRLFGLPQSGLVGVNTWNTIAQENNALIGEKYNEFF